MSIIYDALKKIERSYDSKVGAKKEQKHFKFVFKKIYFLYLLLICLGVIAGRFFFVFLSQPKDVLTEQLPPPPPAEVVAAPAEPSVSPAVEAPAPIEPKKKLEESLVLNGIFFAADGGYALINNQIVKEGDLIEGATVKQISLDEVVLEFEGSAIKLPAKK